MISYLKDAEVFAKHLAPVFTRAIERAKAELRKEFTAELQRRDAAVDALLDEVARLERREAGE